VHDLFGVRPQGQEAEALNGIVIDRAIAVPDDD
jgi:hypothetical protein